MIELSIEEKAKAYDNIIEKANKMHSENCETCQMCIEELIPELKESEDEKVCKEIKQFIRSRGMQLAQSKVESWIAWLEKQGNLMGALQEANKKIGELVEENYYLKEQGEQKPDKVEPKFKAGDKVISTLTNNPYYITEVCNGHYQTDMGCIIMFNAQDNFELVEQKPAWNEDDETALGDALWCCKQAASIAKDENDMGNIWYAERWLKSLKDRYTWKPSEEQMNALNYVTNFDYGGYKATLVSLYEQLKRLNRIKL